MPAAPPSSSSPRTGPQFTSSGRLFRADIEGLRGFAIALVVVFHIFVGKVSSGVDVFLFLGGVFFFSSQLGAALSGKGLTFPQALLRMIRRLYPHLVLVVAVTLIASLALMSRLNHLSVARDAMASLLYFQNWNLAFSGREYEVAQDVVSPYQHLWSMAAQFQIYVASLVVIWLFAVLARLLCRSEGQIDLVRARRGFVVLLSLATLASFAYAVFLHFADQPLNYYSTLTRFWEIGAGGLVGMVIATHQATPRPDGSSGLWMSRVPTAARALMGAFGVAAILATGVFLDGASTFPGPWTLLPLGGAMLIVLAGTYDHRYPAVAGQPVVPGKFVGVQWLFASAPMQFLGRISYGLYLWHWPVLILALQVFPVRTGGGTNAVFTSAQTPTHAATLSVGTGVSIPLGLAVIALSVGLAWAGTRWVEVPLRGSTTPSRSWWKLTSSFQPAKLAAGMAVIATAATVISTPQLIAGEADNQTDFLWSLAADPRVAPGARAWAAGYPTKDGNPIVPPLEDFEALVAITATDGCSTGFAGAQLVTHQGINSSDVPCEYGDTSSDRVLVAFGASHAEQYMSALDRIGKARGFKVIPLFKMACPLNAQVRVIGGEENPECAEWTESAIRYIIDLAPSEGVLMNSTRPSTMAGHKPEMVAPEFVEATQRFTDANIHTFLVRDNPWFTQDDPENVLFNMRVCVAEMMEGSGSRAREANFPGVADPMRVTAQEIAAINAVCGAPADSMLERVSPVTGLVDAAFETTGGAIGTGSFLSLMTTSRPIGLPADANETGYIDGEGNRYYITPAEEVYYVDERGRVFRTDEAGNATPVSASTTSTTTAQTSTSTASTTTTGTAPQNTTNRTTGTPTTTSATSATSTGSSSTRTTGTTTAPTTDATRGTASKLRPLPRDPEFQPLPNNGPYRGLNVTHIDLTSAYCHNNWCPGIIGNMAVYRDSHHFNRAFSASLAPELERQMFGKATVK